ncbi:MULTISPECIES: siderophore-interacting protein [Streptomyces]|jgi:NADPH-dependent ferric siderophore reductase|uniref:Siderophore-interacting protein n=2 Tax=Streptomyces bottropensis TaxID=42235 RepID=M3FK74_9ACTN|nr:MULTISPECIES: siderophore-interacting protein [Streptomyces]EMF52474.1 siderophore-interacting protein [Streptomyces bottropensis ATCC 25435]MZD21580.1 SIP domain-containing protein [Streptomyces sp. SID5476]
MGQGHGWEGAVLRLLRGKDFVLTVTGAEQVTEHYRRVHLTDGGMLATTGVHPTMWVRLWFDAAGKPHQRAYTLVDPDPAAGTFSLEFALHDGHASDWARTAKSGDTIEATVQGTAFTEPDPTPSHILAIGDPASLPALNSLLGALPSAPATIWFETPTDTGAPTPEAGGLPLRLDPTRHDLRPVPRQDAGARLLTRVRADAPALLANTPAPYVWIACDTTTTRSLTTYFRKELGLPKQRTHALGYWRP